MVLDINRRWFLTALTAAGAVIALPVPIGAASPVQIEQAWNQLISKPWFFEVATECGTLVEAGVPDPKINADIYDIGNLDYVTTPARLLQEISSYNGIREHFDGLCERELEDLQARLEYEPKKFDRNEIRRARRYLKLLKAWNDGHDAWEPWVRRESKQDFPRFKKMLEDFLAADLDWSQMEIWPRGWSGQGKALSFFDGLGREINEALGIVIIEGECPGSTYFGAELRNSIENANETAQELRLPFRFRQEAMRPERSA